MKLTPLVGMTCSCARADVCAQGFCCRARVATQIGLDSLGRPSGEAWLSFINANEALKLKIPGT
eukprot:1159918-Pelagomonas_calceolata.AAC.1